MQAARVTGVAPMRIMRKHVLPNVLGPVMVLATIQVATAIITEATLSFLGVGAPPTSPSLGTLIRIGNDYLFSGEWWITIFPGVMLVLIALSVNLLGDWLRDALNPVCVEAYVLLKYKTWSLNSPAAAARCGALDDMSFSIAPGEILGVVG